MKKIEVVIPDRALGELNSVFREFNVGGMSHYRVEGRGRGQAKPVSVGRGTSHYIPEFIPRTKVEVVVPDSLAEELINKILEKIGGPSFGGKIFVSDMPVAIDLKTKERGEQAL
ncbi:MAG: transcriptional regulator [Nitrososphaera sp.]|nr:transcriptional regulator [Nitrososphaera sp.]